MKLKIRKHRENETKNWFFKKKDNKIDKFQEKLAKIKTEKTQITNIRNETGSIFYILQLLKE